MLNSRELYDRLASLLPLRWWPDDPWTVMYQAVLVQHTAWSNVEKTSASADLSLSAVSAMSDEELERAVKKYCSSFAAGKIVFKYINLCFSANEHSPSIYKKIFY